MVNIEEPLILLPHIRFPQHWMVQDWLNNTEYGEQFDLVLTDISIDATMSRTVPALRAKTDKARFYWSLRGDPGAKELEDKILDFAKNIRYNT